ncbi:MAG: hypothetical protein GWP19_00210 [Planctomycetia bacterium]|nr:hypothetical protein [Planctomycetia bacterium]
MTLEGLQNRIIRDVPTFSELNELYQDVNKVIREINAKIPGIETTETPVTQETDSESLTLTFASATKTINDKGLGNFTTMGFLAGQKIWFYGDGAVNVTEMTIVSIQNGAATNDQITVSEAITNDVAITGTLEGFTVLTGYSWDNVNKELELKAAVNQLIDVFVDDVALTKKDHDTVFASVNDSEAFYTKIGRSVVKLTDAIFGSEDGTIKVKILADIAELTTTTLATVIDIPQQYEVLMEQGVLYFMLSRPKHAGNMDLRDKMQKFYFQALNDLNVLEINRDVNSINYDKDYKYQGPSTRY